MERVKMRRRQVWHMRWVQDNFAVLERGTSDRQVRHSTSFSGVGSGGREGLKIEPKMLVGGLGTRRMEGARSDFSGGGGAGEV